MEENPTLICELVVGLGKVEIVGVEVEPGGPLAAHTRTRASWPVGLRRGGVIQELGAGALGRSSGLRSASRKRRWWCPMEGCGVGSFTEIDEWICPGSAFLLSIGRVGLRVRVAW